ncbi:heme-binding protein [Bombella apis]|uniref:heme-binding protein n=1 Tax=Bombella apis TaxID=1785988 RepID=UPI0023F0883B|nr:heme-binding protein [Bombella apis]MCT6819174.1 heme-binding protein [Bombella apis]MCT6844801.1 heme-binding protein [Bombella apis]
MNGQMISYLWGFLENLLKEHQASSCLEILDSVGQRLLFLTCGDILPVSLSLSGRKAYTSYVFRMPSDSVIAGLSNFGHVSLLDAPYCFLPGGDIYQPGNSSTPSLFIGLSTNRPDKDKVFVKDLVSGLADVSSDSTKGSSRNDK